MCGPLPLASVIHCITFMYSVTYLQYNRALILLGAHTVLLGARNGNGLGDEKNNKRFRNLISQFAWDCRALI